MMNKKLVQWYPKIFGQWCLKYLDTDGQKYLDTDGTKIFRHWWAKIFGYRWAKIFGQFGVMSKGHTIPPCAEYKPNPLCTLIILCLYSNIYAELQSVSLKS